MRAVLGLLAESGPSRLELGDWRHRRSVIVCTSSCASCCDISQLIIAFLYLCLAIDPFCRRVQLTDTREPGSYITMISYSIFS